MPRRLHTARQGSGFTKHGFELIARDEKQGQTQQAQKKQLHHNVPSSIFDFSNGRNRDFCNRCARNSHSGSGLKALSGPLSNARRMEIWEQKQVVNGREAQRRMAQHVSLLTTDFALGSAFWARDPETQLRCFVKTGDNVTIAFRRGRLPSAGSIAPEPAVSGAVSTSDPRVSSACQPLLLWPEEAMAAVGCCRERAKLDYFCDRRLLNNRYQHPNAAALNLNLWHSKLSTGYFR